MKRKISIVIISAVALISMLGVFTACSSTTSAQTETTASAAETQTGKAYTILVLPKLVGIPIFDVFQKGAEAAGKDFGLNVIYTGPTSADAAAQVKILEDYINQGVDCVAVGPNDPAAFTPSLTKAREKGILVMDWDTFADPSVVDISCRQFDDKVFGQALIEELVKAMGDSGDFAIITGSLTAENLNTWIQAALDYAKEKYPNLNLVTDKIPSDEKQQVAYQKAMELISAYPNLKGILGVSTPAGIGAAQAVQEKGLQDKIAVVGTPLPNDAKPFLKDGSMDAGLLYDPYNFMYACIYLAKVKLDKQPITDGMVIPNINQAITTKDNGRNIIFAPPLVFTKDNVDQYNF